MKILTIFICICINVVLTQDDYNEILSVNVDGLLMKEASIKASATCGMNGPENYCRLVDEGPEANVMCDICDDRNKTKRHPIEYAKSDDQNLWWQSPSMAQGSDYQRINITIDLKQVYQIVYILLKMADSPRPGTWILERSNDGNDYEPWIFFADTPYACYNLFQRHYPTIKLTSSSRPPSLDDDEVFCTTYYSQPNSLVAGEIIISLINGRKSLLIQDVQGPRSIPLKLINFLSARFIRFRFLKPLTLAADLMTHKGHLEKSIYNRYYYSLRNIEIGGKCICNNHADKCDKVIKDAITVAKCNCKHNTCGNNCERCCPLYNQKPWRQGAKCEECNCNNKTQVCTFNQTVATLQLSMNKLGQMDGGGVCVGCRENTAGINCEKCKFRYYRPWNVRAIQPSPCQLCKCYGVGTVGTCISNGEEVDNQKPGDCICKKGYKGEQCDQCDIGYEHRGSECVPCPCSIDGSVGSSMYRCKPPCNCKVNVDSNENCHKCKEHFFYLDRNNPEGCQPCYCFGITDRCASLSGENLKVQSLENWKATTLAMNKESLPRISSLQYPILENTLTDTSLDSPTVYYWSAPSIYLGNWLTSFKSIFQYVIKIELDSSVSGSQIDSPDVIIKCGSAEISHSISSDDRRLQRIVQIPMKERNWKFRNTTESVRVPTKDDFMSCLVDVRALLIKGKYYSNQKTIRLLNVTLDRGDPSNAISNMPHVEKCDCPSGVSGLSCESCEVGYRRVNNVLVGGRCERCECYQHSNSCDPFTGNCKDCLHHTTGQFCDTCEPGYYGNPRKGDKNSCKKCACPLEDYQLSNMCSTYNDNNYICNECTEKSGGPQCQRCTDGYFGNPLKKIPCKKCNCNDNEESCDGLTGHCRCSFNTMGTRCEICKHGFFGDALKKTCQSCNCSSIGSDSQFCNKASGQCSCKANFETRTCDTCGSGLYLHKEECIPCSCDRQGRIETMQFCDPLNGQCKCREGVSGPTCDRCLTEYYGFPDCKKCHCSNHSLYSECNQIDGRCKCGENVEDNKCKNCQDLFYWSNRTDCSSCKCGIGSTQPQCDMNTGQCKCAPYVIGRTCDKCEFNYYGISASGCKECPKCTKGKVCDNDGNCVCPSNTKGETCEICADQSWGYNKTTGCKKCDCFASGSMSQSCDISYGQCTCHPQFAGQRCNKCATNYFGYPQCRPCNCNKDGIVPHQVNACDVTSGVCTCKMNVEGESCDRCKNGTFGFDGHYVAGCYKCYCSGQSQQCSLQTDYRILSDGVYKYRILADDNAFVSGKNQRIIELSTRTTGTLKWPLSFFRPVFADVTQLLSTQDLNLLYGKVAIIAGIDCQSKTCGRENSEQTEAIIESYGGSMELRYVVNHTQEVDRKLVIKLSESSKHGQWLLTRSNNHQLNKAINLGNRELTIVAREIMMLALLNVTKFKIQLYTSTVNPEQIKFTLETFAAVKTKENVGDRISGVEQCQCDDKTMGMHCENPIHGFYRVPNKINEVTFNISFRIGYRIEKCMCNGHSQRCDRATGQCQHCLNNTSGAKCDICADGFYGDPRNNGTCQKCECPFKHHNFAKKCNKTSGSSVFDCECQLGYTGNICDKCQAEYFGNPSKGIECRACNCNPDGSLSAICDDTGKCTCAPGVMGPKCDQCSANYAVEEKKCKDCMAGCTKDLFMRLIKLNDSVVNMKWKSLPSKEEMMIRQINVTVLLIKRDISDVTRFFDLIDEIKRVTNKVDEAKGNLTNNLNNAAIVRDAYNNALIKIHEIFKEINETINGGKDPRVSYEMITNASKILKEINDMKGKMPNAEMVENDLRIVQNHIDKINKFRKEIQSRIQNGQLNNIKELIAKTMMADTINKNNKEYLKELTVTITTYESKMREYQQKIDENQNEYIKALLKKEMFKQQITEWRQQITEFDRKFQQTMQILSEIELLLKNQSTESSSPKDLLIPDSVKELVNNITDRSRDLVKNLRKSFAILSRAEDAKHAYTNISNDIRNVEEAINSTGRQLEDSRTQLGIDKFSKSIDEINKSHDQIIDSKKKKENDLQKLNTQYNALDYKAKQLDNKNLEKVSEIPKQGFEVNIFQTNITLFESKQTTTQQTIDELMKTITSFKVPSFSGTKLKEIDSKVTDLKNQYDDIAKETNTIIGSIKDIRESLRKIRERLTKRKIYTELAHGAAAKSPEPLRLDKSCVRHYKTYYLPKSNAFSLEIYLNPQFYTEQNLVLFGYDNSGSANKAFALTIEKNQKIKFWYDYGTGVNDLTIDSSIFVPMKYSGLSVSWNLGKWEMKHKTLGDDSDSRFGSYSTNKSSINNIFLGPDSHIFLGGFPSDTLISRSNLKLGGPLMKILKENYRTKHYKGCLYGLTLMNVDLGLQDFHNVEEECINAKSDDFVLKQSFNCKVNLGNTAFVDKFRNSIQRQKRDISRDYNIHFTGHGYVMINTSQVTGQCMKDLNRAIRLYTNPHSKISLLSFQFVAVFINEKLDIGFVLGQRNGKFLQAYWKQDEVVPMRQINVTSDLIVWKVFHENNDLIFGIHAICHPQSYMYLGGVPQSEIGLMERLIKLNVPYQSYTGSMKIQVIDKDLFRKSSTRFVHKILKNENQIRAFPFYSLLIPAELSDPILINPEIYKKVFTKGFSLNVDFLGVPLNEEITLITIDSSDNKISLKVSPGLEFSVLVDKKKLSLRALDIANKWGSYFVVVNIQTKSESTEIELTVNEPNIKMEEFPIKLDTQVNRIELGQLGLQRAFQIYDVFLGDSMVNFNSPPMSILPANAYLKVSPSQLSPSASSPASSSTDVSKNDLRVSSRNREILQSDVSALPYTNNRHLYSSSIRASTYILTSFQSEDYPLDSGWFEGVPNNTVSLSGPILDTYLKERGNKISIRLASYSMKPEMILSINFGPSKKLNLVTMNKQAILYEPESKWNSILRVPIINKDWHLIEISASYGVDKGLFVKLDGHTFDYPAGPLSFTKPTLIEIGGSSDMSKGIYYKGQYHEIGMFMGCLDSLKINDNKVSLRTDTVGQCARVLEFLDIGVEILNTYAMVNDPNDIVKLIIGNYNMSTYKNTVTTEFKFKYTGFEQGSLIVTGDGTKFCAIVLYNKKIHLNCKDFKSGVFKTDSLDLQKEKWYNVEFLVHHMTGIVNLFKVTVDEKVVQKYWTGNEVFSKSFIRPDIYLGAHPGLSKDMKKALTNTDRNFVGCISELNVRIHKLYVSSSLSKSRYIIPGRCSVDKFTYLRNL